MPGLVLFNRRWGIGSDDLILPASALSSLNLFWIIGLTVVLSTYEWKTDGCSKTLKIHLIVYLCSKCLNFFLELVIGVLSTRGTILDTDKRQAIRPALYIRLGLYICEVGWLTYSSVWIGTNYTSCEEIEAKRTILGVVVFNWVVIFAVILALWCSFDSGGRHWVRMKRFQDSTKNSQRGSHRSKRTSGNTRRNWRQRNGYQPLNTKATRAYQQSWDKRCGLFFCCIKDEHNRNSFSEVAQLFTDFFRDLDVVPSDIIAGLVLLRQHQKNKQKYIISRKKDDVFDYLSGVPITPQSKFLNLQLTEEKLRFDKIVLYMRYAMAAYGWPMFCFNNPFTGLCRILPDLRCCCSKKPDCEVIDDNCCLCNLTAIKKVDGLQNIELVYANYHVDIEETPFYVALDHNEKVVVIAVRGTLSLRDVLTDLKAEAEPLPLDPVDEEWLGHKGMVQTALYIRNKLQEDNVLKKAFNKYPEKATKDYDLVLVGHSLGAGTAAILAVLLKKEYPSLHCYAYAPPGGLLSKICVDKTKHFITSCVLGKDVVPRIGLSQLEVLRNDLINVIKTCKNTKWKVIGGNLLCCCCCKDSSVAEDTMTVFDQEEKKRGKGFNHPRDKDIHLSTHQALHPPGSILHIVRNHSSKKGCRNKNPLYNGVWVNNDDFDEVLISPTMLNDHMPHIMLKALQQVTTPEPIVHDETQGLLEQPNLSWDDAYHHGGCSTDAPLAAQESFTDQTPQTTFEESQRLSVVLETEPIAQSTPMQTETLFPVRPSSDNSCRQVLFQTEPSFDMTAEEKRIEEKLKEAERGYKLAFDNDMSYERHSPDSSSNQLVYDGVNNHYSSAGRGYPHGAYLPETETKLLLNDSPITDV